MSRTYDNFADLITFSRASSGTAMRPISYGPELVTNGTFDTDLTGWIDDESQWTVSGSRAYHALESNFGTLRQPLSFTVGKLYLITFDYEVLEGELRCQARTSSNTPLGTLGILNITGTGSLSALFTPDSLTHSVAFARDNIGESSEFYVDNVSVREVLFDQPDGTMTLFNHPENIPRIDFDPVTGDRKGLLIEEARTNEITESEVLDADSSEYTGKNLNATDPGIQDGTLAPDGVTQAYFSLESSGNAERRLEIDNFVPTVSTTYTVSVFAKAKTDHVRRLGFRGFGAGATNTYPVFDLVNGTVINAGSNWSNTQIEDYGNGWYRCSSVVSTITANSLLLHILADNADGSGLFYVGNEEGGLYFWGLQIEEGSFPTSYIPTSGSTVTRSADVASIATSAFGYNQNEGTLFGEYQLVGLSGTTAIIYGDSANARFIYHTSGTIRSYDGTTIESVSVASDTQANKVAMFFDTSEFGLSVLGGTVEKSSYDGTGFNDASEFDLNPVAGNYHIKKLQYFPRRLSDTELQEITS
jgi:hypothetical protein